MAKIQFPLQFERQYSNPIDIDMVFETSSILNSYLTDDKRYAGMVVTCKEQEGKIFVLNNDKNEWLTFDSSLYEKTANKVTSFNTPTDTEYHSAKLLKEYVDSKVSSVYKIKVSVADYLSLPTGNLTVGDVYNLSDTGDNYVWDGTDWDKLGGTIDLSSYALKTDIKEDVVFQATSLDSLTSVQKLAITTQIDDVLTSGEIDKEKFKNFILEITLTGNKYYEGIQASASSFSGSTTNYLQSETNVDEAIKELDTQVKATNDSISTAYTLPQASTNTRGGIRADIKQATDTVEVKIDVASEKLFVPTYLSKISDLTNDSGFATETYVNNKVSAVYKPQGSVLFSSLVVGLLVAANSGFVYNITDAFTTNENFVEGAGKSHSAGTNVVIIEHSGNYKFDVLGGTVDLTPYELLSNKVTSWSSTTDNTRYPSEKLVKGSLDELDNKIEGVSDLSPYHFERTFVGGDLLQNDFDNLIVDYEDLSDGLAFKETKLQGSYFVCSADS